jgi:G:T-mismatch repair DNA endonuclease (very short patch repair protein)
MLAKMTIPNYGNTHHLGKHISEEAKDKIRKVHKGNKYCVGRVASEETKKKLSESHMGLRNHLGIPHSLETRYRQSQARLRLWQDNNYREKAIRAILQSCSIKPNKPEKKLMELLEVIQPNEWKYVGDGSFMIGDLNPDFINTNGKNKAIEMFGDYWHSDKKVKSVIATEDGRKIAFKNYGYDVLIVWEHELHDIDKVKQRIILF